MRGQIGSVDAVISLSVLTAMLVIWAHMFQDASPLFQIYTYRETAAYADHVANKLLFDISAPWICRTPNGIPIPACVKSGSSISASDLDLNDLNVACNLSCVPAVSFTHPCTSTPPSTPQTPVFVRRIRLCSGDWNSCVWSDCNLEVWHR